MDSVEFGFSGHGHPGPAHQEALAPSRKSADGRSLRILAVDWGMRRIGLAVSDPTGVIATALPTSSCGAVSCHRRRRPRRGPSRRWSESWWDFLC
jgi:hypothetical protein